MYFCLKTPCYSQNSHHTNCDLAVRYTYTSPLCLCNPLVQVSFRLKFLLMLSKTGLDPVSRSTVAFVLCISRTKRLPHSHTGGARTRMVTHRCSLSTTACRGGRSTEINTLVNK